MLARTSKLVHKSSGIALETPLLVPAFSSKGFRISGRAESEIAGILRASAEFITETLLISAYDIHYGYVPKAKELPCRPELVIVDSGGYEISENWDLSSVLQMSYSPNEWSANKLKSVIDDWPDEIPAVFVSYDHQSERVPFNDQLALARELFKRHFNQLHMFIIKPETSDQQTTDRALKAARANIEDLGSFDAIGLTENELGRNMLDRMVRIALLRREMDEAGIRIPIHVFGALDPVAVCLYFISGAEIFDGLTWIRYIYDEGRCVYSRDVGALKYGIHTPDDVVRTRGLANNIYYLYDLQNKLRDFEATRDFGKLPHSNFLKDATDSLKRRLAKGGK